MSNFKDKLEQILKEKENIEEPEEKGSEEKEHPIVEQLQNIPNTTRMVNPPKPEELPEEPKEEPEEPKLTPCPNCGKEFKHLSRHRCKQAEPIEEVKTEEPVSIPEGSTVQTEETNVNYVQTDGSSTNPDYKITTGCTCCPTESEDILQLYIDAIPLDDSYINLIDFLFPILESIEKDHKVEHWRMLEFGKDCDELVRKLELYIDYKAPTGIVYLDSSTKEGRACKETLREHAAKVVLGVR